MADKNQKVKEVALDKAHATPEDKSVAQRLRRVLDATSIEKPKPEDVQELSTHLKEYPELWRLAGDFSRHAINRILEGATKQVLVRESVKHGLEVLRKDLGFEKSPALEKILIENIVVCWLQLQVTQTKYEANTHDGLRVAEYWERRLSATNARYLRACETLARIRRLSRPSAVQVNIGEKQVNVTQGPNATKLENIPK